MRKFWVRVLIMGFVAFAAISVSQLVEYAIPNKLAQSVNRTSADRLLNVIASAMLSVTIFSITVMVSVNQPSSSQWTPRIHRLILQDRNPQTTMAMFIGAYVYALLGVILRETGVYDDDHAFFLFWMTVAVLIVSVVYLICCVLHLQGFGQLIDITRQIETTTRDQFTERLSEPCLGACPFTGELPEDTHALNTWENGYFQHIYPEVLKAAAKNHGVELYVTQNIGSFVFLNAPILQVHQTSRNDSTGTACAKACAKLWWWEIFGPMIKTRVSG